MAYQFLSTILGSNANFTGNLGVGTTTPGTLLQVKGNGNNMISLQYASNGGSAGYGFYNSSGTELWSIGGGRFVSQDALEISRQGSLKFIIDSNGFVGMNVSNPQNQLVLPNTQYIAWKNSTGIESVGISCSNTDALTFYNNAERMRITAAGNVGIGTASPSYKLTVQDTVNTGTIAIGNVTYPGLIYSNASTGEFRVDNRTSAGAGYITFFPNGQGSTVGSEAMRIVATGNVLIGTTTDAGYKLDVNGTGRFVNSVTIGENYYINNSSSSLYGLVNQYNGSVFAYSQAAAGSGEYRHYIGPSSGWGGHHTFYTDNAERMRINSGGNVGIGTSNPISKLNVLSAGTTAISISNTSSGTSATPQLTQLNFLGFLQENRGRIEATDVSSSANGSELRFYNANTSNVLTQQMVIMPTGNVLIGTNTDSGYKLDVNGTGRFSSNFYVSGGTNTNVGNGIHAYYESNYAQVQLNGATGSLIDFSISGTDYLARILYTNSTNLLEFKNNVGTTNFSLANSGTATFANLGGSGTRMVVADGLGTLSTQAIPTGTITGSGTTNYISKWSSSSSLTNSVMSEVGTIITVAGSGRFLGFDSGYYNENILAIGNGTYNPKIGLSSISGYRWNTRINDVGGNGEYIIRYEEGNLDALIINRNGNVLIGTTTDAGYKLRVNGSTYIDGTTGMYGQLYFTNFYAAGVPFDFIQSTYNGAGACGIKLTAYNPYNGTDSGLGLQVMDNGGNYVQPLFVSGRFNSVGIGTTTPAYKLDVNGSFRASAPVVTGDPNGYASFQPLYFAGAPNTPTTYFQVISNGNGSDFSQLGIGSNNRMYYRWGTNAWTELQAVISNPITGSGTTNYIPKFTGSTAVGNSSIYDNGGNIGIGLTNADYPLTVGSINVGGAGANLGIILNSVINSAIPSSSIKAVIGVANSGYGYAAGSLLLQPRTGVGAVTAFATEGVERMRITADGNVGIGITSPIAKLQTYVTTIDYALCTENANPSGDQNFILFRGGANIGSIYRPFSTNDVRFNSNYGAIAFGTDGSGSPAERMRITSGGNVLIGTTTDSGYKLDVNGTGAFSSNLSILNGSRIYFNNSSNSASGNIYCPGGGSLVLQAYSQDMLGLIQGDYVYLSTSNTERMRITNTGNVGIGTTNPTSSNWSKTLQLEGSSAGFKVASSSANGEFWAAGDVGINVNTAGKNLYLGNANSLTAFTLDSSGNVGIGTTNPTNTLTVIGLDYTTVRSQNSWSSNYFTLSNTNGSYSASVFSIINDLAFATSNSATERMRITNAGNVLIGTTTDVGIKLYVSGGIRANGSNGQVDVDPTSGALRFYDGSTFRGGFGTDAWATGGSAANLTTYLDSGNYYIYSNSAAAKLFTVLSGGNVGIGTTSPLSKLDISGGSYNTGLIVRSSSTNGTGAALLNTDTGGHDWYIISTATSNGGGAGNLGFYDSTNGNYHFYIKGSNGNVGIGTTSPGYKLQVSGESMAILNPNGPSSLTGADAILYLGGSAVPAYIKAIPCDWYAQNYRLEIGTQASTTSQKTYLTFVTEGAERMRIASSGNVLIGTATDYGNKLLVNGSFRIGTTYAINWENYSYGSYLDVINNQNALRIRNASNVIMLEVNGSSNYFNGDLKLLNGGDLEIHPSSGSSYTSLYNDNDIFNLWNNGAVRLSIGTAGAITIPNLGGSGTRMVVADSTGTLSTQAIPGGGGSANGSWQENSTQTAPANNTGVGVKFSTLNFRTGVNVIPDSGGQPTLIQMAATGRYDIQFSFQFENADNTAELVYVWLRKNGENTPDDIPDSNTIISVPAKHGSTPGKCVAAWNFFVEANAGDFFQLAWATADATNVSMPYYAATGFCPATPSAILTVNQVD
jgi:hypothetical protein